MNNFFSERAEQIHRSQERIKNQGWILVQAVICLAAFVTFLNGWIEPLASWQYYVGSVIIILFFIRLGRMLYKSTWDLDINGKRYTPDRAIPFRWYHIFW